MTHLTDVLFWIYILGMLTSFTGFSIFVWWWYKVKRATVVYSYVTLLLLSQTFFFSVHVYERYLILNRWKDVREFLDGPLWILRVVFLVLVTAVIVIHVGHRIIIMKKRQRSLINRRRSTPDKEFAEEIIVVDDNPNVISVVKSGLKIGFPKITIHDASTAEEALDLFSKKKNVNLVLTDLYLSSGRLDGFALCQIIKDECPWTIVVAMTGYTDTFEFWNVRAAGFDDYLGKPFPVRELINTVRTHFYTIERWKGAQYRKHYDERKEDAETIDRGLGECIIHCTDGREAKGLCGRRLRLHREGGGGQQEQNRRHDDPPVVPPDPEDV